MRPKVVSPTELSSAAFLQMPKAPLFLLVREAWPLEHSMLLIDLLDGLRYERIGGQEQHSDLAPS